MASYSYRDPSAWRHLFAGEGTKGAHGCMTGPIGNWLISTPPNTIGAFGRVVF
jgi:hypothetical protein